MKITRLAALVRTPACVRGSGCTRFCRQSHPSGTAESESGARAGGGERGREATLQEGRWGRGARTLTVQESLAGDESVEYPAKHVVQPALREGDAELERQRQQQRAQRRHVQTHLGRREQCVVGGGGW